MTFTIAFILHCIYSTYAVGLEFEFVNDKMLMYFQKLLDGSPLDGGVQVSKILINRSTDWKDCVKLGRLKFEKYFNHRVSC